MGSNRDVVERIRTQNLAGNLQLKTLNGQSVIGTGNLVITSGEPTGTETNGGLIAIGEHSASSALKAVSMGDYVIASGESSLAIGDNVTSSGLKSVAIGNTNTTASGNKAVAVGYASLASGDISFSLFGKSVGNFSLSIGSDSEANGLASIAYGLSSKALADYAVVIGYNAKSSSTNSIALGFGSNIDITTAGNALAIGSEASIIDTLATGGVASISLGNKAVADGSKNISLGYQTKTLGSEALAIGSNSKSLANKAISIGDNSRSINQGATVIGSNSAVRKNNSLVIGNNINMSATSSYKIMIGSNASTFDEATQSTSDTDFDIGVLDNGTTVLKGLKISNGASANKVLTSDANGVATWQDIPAPVIPDQMVYIQETEPVVAAGKSALWIVPLPNGSFTMNIIQN